MDRDLWFWIGLVAVLWATLGSAFTWWRWRPEEFRRAKWAFLLAPPLCVALYVGVSLFAGE